MSIWNTWHGCHKISPGCANCYVYRRDETIGKDECRIHVSVLYIGRLGYGAACNA